MNRRGFLLTVAGTLAFPRAALAGGVATVLVTADRESRVLAFGALDGRPLGSIRTLPGPASIESCGEVAVVGHPTAGALTLIELGTLRVRSVIRGVREPRYAAAHPDGRHAYVTDSAAGEVVALDLRRGRVAGRVRVGGPARHLSLSPDGDELWAVLGNTASGIAVVDTRVPWRPRSRLTLRAPFLAHDVCFDPDGGHVWISSGDRGRIALFDPRNRRLAGTVAADLPPQHVAFGARRAYVASGDSGTLRVYGARDAELERTTRIPLGSYNVTAEWARVFTPSLTRGSLSILDARGRLLHSRRVSSSSHDAAFVVTP